MSPWNITTASACLTSSMRRHALPLARWVLLLGHGFPAVPLFPGIARSQPRSSHQIRCCTLHCSTARCPPASAVDLFLRSVRCNSSHPILHHFPPRFRRIEYFEHLLWITSSSVELDVSLNVTMGIEGHNPYHNIINHDISASVF